MQQPTILTRIHPTARIDPSASSATNLTRSSVFVDKALAIPGLTHTRSRSSRHHTPTLFTHSHLFYLSHQQWLALAEVPHDGGEHTLIDQWAPYSLHSLCSHTKSRKGCKTCKRRHIRCDETFPQWCGLPLSLHLCLISGEHQHLIFTTVGIARNIRCAVTIWIVRRLEIQV